MGVEAAREPALHKMGPTLNYAGFLPQAPMEAIIVKSGKGGKEKAALVLPLLTMRIRIRHHMSMISC
jgi:hypothetical protein